MEAMPTKKDNVVGNKKGLRDSGSYMCGSNANKEG